MSATLIVKSVRNRLRNFKIKYPAVLSSGIRYSGSIFVSISTSTALSDKNKRMSICAGISCKLIGISSLEIYFKLLDLRGVCMASSSYFA